MLEINRVELRRLPRRMVAQGPRRHRHASTSDVHFKGPMQELNGREAVLASSKRIFPLLERLEVRVKIRVRRSCNVCL